jgi:hypothetical protein
MITSSPKKSLPIDYDGCLVNFFMSGLFKLAYLSYVETAKKINLDAVDKLSGLINCEVGDLFERV